MRVRTETRRETIVAAATVLFLEQGYERATMGELTRRLGGSKATVYGYFGSKLELFVAVIEAMASTHLADAEAELEAMAAVGVERGLTRFAEHLLALMVQDDALALHRVILGESGSSEVGELFVELGPRRTLQSVSRAMRSAMERGEMQPGPADALAQQFLGLVRAEVDLRSFLRQPPPLSPAQIAAMARRAVQMFLGGYRAVESATHAA